MRSGEGGGPDMGPVIVVGGCVGPSLGVGGITSGNENSRFAEQRRPSEVRPSRSRSDPPCRIARGRFALDQGPETDMPTGLMAFSAERSRFREPFGRRTVSSSTTFRGDSPHRQRASPARPAPSEPRQGRKAAAVGGRSGALRVACPFFFCRGRLRPHSGSGEPAVSRPVYRAMRSVLTPCRGDTASPPKF